MSSAFKQGSTYHTVSLLDVVPALYCLLRSTFQLSSSHGAIAWSQCGLLLGQERKRWPRRLYSQNACVVHFDLLSIFPCSLAPAFKGIEQELQEDVTKHGIFLQILWESHWRSDDCSLLTAAERQRRESLISFFHGIVKIPDLNKKLHNHSNKPESLLH